jgi:hypothetical protein
MMQSSLWQIVRTMNSEDPTLDIPEGSATCGHGQASCGNPPPQPHRPPTSLEQLLATQNNLMQILMVNETHRGAEH